jgi:all-trans-retinol dehydrogenase (NAD+)
MPHHVRMHLVRSLAAAGLLIVLIVGPSSDGSPNLLPLSEEKGTLLLRVLRWGIGALFVREVNTFLSEWAENRWAFGPDEVAWEWKNEVAVVTGGSGGIGALVVKQLVSHDLRVAVFDVQPLSSDFTESTPPLARPYGTAELANLLLR